MTKDNRPLSSAPVISHENNFDLIRLIAAAQVALSHGASHLNYSLPRVLHFLSFIPGVPIFFTVSGFLIGNAYSRKPALSTYTINRALRIFPGLWACLLVNTILLFLFKGLNWNSFYTIEFWKWVICQVSVFQFYTPDILRGWGTGTPNGSLWTIPVELQFYILLPFMVTFITKSKIFRMIGLIILIMISIYSNQYYNTIDQETIFAKLFHVSILPFLLYFLIGYLLFFFWLNIKKYIIDKAFIWFVIYLLYVLIFYYYTKSYQLTYYPNLFGWIANLILSALILSCAFSYRSTANKILKGNDLSYGIYIYHMVIINLFLELNVIDYSLPIALFATAILALLSWKFVEKPCLDLKRKLNRHPIS